MLEDPPDERRVGEEGDDLYGSAALGAEESAEQEHAVEKLGLAPIPFT